MKNDEMLKVPGGWAEITVTGLRITKTKPEKKDWHEAWEIMLAARQMSAWAIGDLYNVGKGMGEDIAQYINAAGISLKTCQNHGSVCFAYPYGSRSYPPSFTHHEIVAKLEPKRRVYWLKRCVEEDIDSMTLRELTIEERGEKPKSKASGVEKILAGVKMALVGCDELGIEAERLGYREPLLWIQQDIEGVKE